MINKVPNIIITGVREETGQKYWLLWEKAENKQFKN